MILVAGLAVAGLVGIAAAFYFSIRSGNRSDRRVRSAGAGRAGADRRPGGRSSGTARPARAARAENGRQAANGGRSVKASRGAKVSSRNYRAEGSTGPHPVLDFGDPVLDGGRRGGPGAPARSRPADPQATDSRLAAARPGDSRPGDSRPGSRSAARPSREGHVGRDAGKTRRRVGLRKGADVDEEMWPAETFGGVSDEQFWDDLASDKPLTTTARTAQQDSGVRSRPLDAVLPADKQAAQAPALDLGDTRDRAEGRRGAGSSAYPESRTGPNPAAERTAVQPAYTATRPVQSMAPQVPGATQPAQAAGRRRASSAEEDPLTSAAFSLRASGPVDGRSSRTPRGSRDTTTAAYPYPGTPYGDPSPVSPSVNTPPYGESYGYRDPVAQPDDPRRPNGTRSHARHGGHGGHGEGNRAQRHAYLQDGNQGTGYQTGGYPVSGYQVSGYQAGGYQSGGYQGNGHRAPYDPREDYRRLTQPR